MILILLIILLMSGLIFYNYNKKVIENFKILYKKKSVAANSTNATVCNNDNNVCYGYKTWPHTSNCNIAKNNMTNVCYSDLYKNDEIHNKNNKLNNKKEHLLDCIDFCTYNPSSGYKCKNTKGDEVDAYRCKHGLPREVLRKGDIKIYNKYLQNDLLGKIEKEIEKIKQQENIIKNQIEKNNNIM